MRKLILLQNGLVEADYESGRTQLGRQILGTILSNIAYYGYVPSKELYNQISYFTVEGLEQFWSDLEPVLRDITGASKEMEKHVVYKNFPTEVLEMGQAEYWFKQILMYIGFPSELFSEEEKPRETLLENIQLKVLQPANEDSLQRVADSILRLPNRWIPEQQAQVRYLVETENVAVDVAKVPFKENLVQVVQIVVESGGRIAIKSATDVLRLAVGMSDGDVSMRTPSKFRSFTRAERRFFLSNLESASSLRDDMGRDPNKWKKFMKAIRPGDYRKQFPEVCSAYDDLYNGRVKTFNSKVESALEAVDPSVIDLLATRPGEYVRRLHHLLALFGKSASDKFVSTVVPKLKVVQLLKIEKYIEAINDRKFRAFAPRGNWNKIQIVDNGNRIDERLKKTLLRGIRDEVAKRVGDQIPTVLLDEAVRDVKIQGNDSELTPYGRGTTFPIPDDINFIRTASYWQVSASGYNIWYDNGWNFFDDKWNELGACCWNENSYAQGSRSKGAVFSSDPTTGTSKDKKACQLIDLYLDDLEKMGVRYAVWNVLCYSRQKFSEAVEVYAVLQWGKDAEKGKLVEPSRAQMAFPLAGDNLTKYIAYIDVKERKLVYIDANLKGTVQSAALNGKILSSQMPAFCEYLDTQPSVYDLFKGVEQSAEGTPVVYDDLDVTIEGREAFVFRPSNEENKYEQLVLADLLS